MNIARACWQETPHEADDAQKEYYAITQNSVFFLKASYIFL